ncbi:MAG: TonB-dependent receptor, partial [Pseudomonadota bacterium]
MFLNKLNPIAKALAINFCACVSISCLSFSVAAQEEQQREITAAANSLGDTINELVRIYGVDILVSERLVSGKRSNPISGSYSAESALKIVLDGTGIEVQQTTEGNFILVESEALIENTNSTIESQALKPEVENIVVTGTRIRRSGASAPSPVDIVSSEDIAAFGLVDTTEALRFVPALSQSVSATTQELGGRTSFAAGREGQAGLATLNLRGLGTERTLVLVNGRRHVGGVTGEATVDVNSIPSALIERVEVLTGGGSSIYGADAVSGVVNYIINDSFEGIDLTVNYGVPTEGGGNAIFSSLTMGGNFADDRGNAVISLEYQNQDNLRRDERSFTNSGSGFVPNSPALTSAFGFDADAVNVLIPNVRSNNIPDAGLGSVTFLGNTILASGTAFAGTSAIGGVPVLQVIERANGTVRPYDFGTRAGLALFSNGGDGTVFLPGFSPNSDTIPEIERYTINGFADYDITSNINAFTEVKYTRVESSSRVLFSINPFNLVISPDNPFTPQTLVDQRNSLEALGEQTDLVVSLNLSEDIIQQPREAVRETFRVVGGIRGEISRAFNYELSVNYGRTDTLLANNAELIPDRFFAAVDAVADPVTGDPICRSEIDAVTPFPTSFFPTPAMPGFNTFAPGNGTCVPFNVFSLATPEFANFAFLRTEQTFKLDQFVVNGTVTGNSEEFFELPAGGIGYAAGIEYREEESSYQPDPLQIANLGFLSAFSDDVPNFGTFDVTEFFAEFNIPVLIDKPFANSLNLDASVRVADYSTVGTTTSYALGTVWEPVETLRLRASFNRSVRAPNIGELFTPQVTNPGQVNPDPCSETEISNGSSTRAANCAQFVPDGFNPPVTSLDVSILSGGNPDLAEETADTFTIGFVYQPAAIPGLTILADYYDIEIEDGILSGVTDEIIVTNCVDASTIINPFCDAVTRDPATGLVTDVQATNLNLSAIKAEGVDYQIEYTFNLDSVLDKWVGDFTASVNGTWLLQREDVPFADFPEATEVFDEEIRFPEHFVNVALRWNYKDWSADYGFNYQSSQFRTFGFPAIDREVIESNPNIVNESKTGSAFVHYLGGTYTFSDQYQVSLRINNLFNEEPFFG